jgi:hypothetical protein
MICPNAKDKCICFRLHGLERDVIIEVCSQLRIDVELSLNDDLVQLRKRGAGSRQCNNALNLSYAVIESFPWHASF